MYKHGKNVQWVYFESMKRKTKFWPRCRRKGLSRRYPITTDHFPSACIVPHEDTKSAVCEHFYS